jgi:hypothetical protein
LVHHRSANVENPRLADLADTYIIAQVADLQHDEWAMQDVDRKYMIMAARSICRRPFDFEGGLLASTGGRLAELLVGGHLTSTVDFCRLDLERRAGVLLP